MLASARPEVEKSFGNLREGALFETFALEKLSQKASVALAREKQLGPRRTT